MVRILSNLPLECFDDRANLRDVELVTYGPPDRMVIDQVHFPFDVAFDPSRGSWQQLAAALPRGFTPDYVLLWWPDQEPLPANLHECPVPVIGIVSDYNLSLPQITNLQSTLDVLLCDRAGVPLFSRLGYADVRYFCQYTYKRPFHRRMPGIARDLDVGFAGNLNPAVQRDRAPWITRLGDLGARGIRVEVRNGLYGADYGRFLNRCRIGWNRSIRSEMNLRAFEVPACGALLMMERDNLEVRDFFVPDEECVLYGQDDFEDLVSALVRDPARIERIAAAGHARVQDYALGKRMPALLDLLAQRGPGRRTPDAGLAALGRAEAMLTTWANGEALVAAAMDACRQRPTDARALNVLALATLRWRGSQGAQQALQLLHRAFAADPCYAPAAANLAHLLAFGDRADLQLAAVEAFASRVNSTANPLALAGPVLPFGYTKQSVDWSLALQSAARHDDFTAARASAQAAQDRLAQGSIRLAAR